ncbi:hypothetical protein MDA_GLEAN10008920 [Myotis davidii]|uniref:Uncharacterized protein n=1 Tax=Myotis davidii TaxID=225400 RepID=L5M6Z5_MYODS|nr:hypothetical protein MDA_GLEAN10008920 [Myotis davidii]
MAAGSQAAENRRLGYPSDEEAKVPCLQLRGLGNGGADRPPGRDQQSRKASKPRYQRTREASGGISRA